MAGGVRRAPGLLERMEADGWQRRVAFAESAAERIRRSIRDQGLIDTGALLAGVGVMLTGGKVRVGIFGVPYAADIEFGTRSHLIEGAFGREGAVRHPGTHPYYPVKKGVLAEVAARRAAR